MREVTLIGGTHHRKKYTLNRGQQELQIPRISPYIMMETIHPITYEPIKFDIYIPFRISLGHIRDYDDFFILNTINQEEWLINLIKDYVR